MFNTFLIRALILLPFLGICASVPTYFIATPKHLERWVPNDIVVSLFDQVHPTNVTTTLNGVTKVIDFTEKDQTASFSFQFNQDHSNDQYDLVVTGVGGMPFKQALKIELVYSKFVVIFQLTSLVYQPGDLVIFRAIILNEKFFPVKYNWITDSRITIKDPGNEKRAIFIQINGEIKPSEVYGQNYFNISKGITNDISFRLDKHEHIGTWQIEMKINDHVEIIKFDVKPDNENFAYIDLNATSYKTYNDPEVHLSINSQYYFGESVKGNSQIDVIKLNDCGQTVPAENRTSLFKKQAKFDRTTMMKINFNDFPGLNPRCDDVFGVQVSIDDSITGQVYQDTVQVNFTKQNIKVRAVNKNERLKIGMKFRVVLEFSYVGNTEFDLPSIDDKLKIEALVNNKNNLISSNIVMSKNRKFLDYLIEPGTLNMTINVKLSDELVYEHTYLALDPGCAKTLLSINYQDSQKRLEINEIASLIVSSNQDISYLNYFFIVNEKIVNSSSITYKSPAKVVVFNLHITMNIMPRSKVFIYFYSPATNSYGLDYIDIDASEYFQNFIKVSVDEGLVTENNLTHIEIKSKPQSNILIHAYNVENLNNMRKDNLFEQQIIKNWKNKMAIYNQDAPIASQVQLISNSPSFCSTPYELAQILASPSVYYHDEGKINKNFRHTWIWDKLNIQANNSLKITAISPNNNPVWQFSAISLNDHDGIGITKEPLELNIAQRFFVQINNFADVKKDVRHNINVLVHNPFNKKMTFDIAFEELSGYPAKIEFDSCDQAIDFESSQTRMINCSFQASSIGEAKISLTASDLSGNTTLDHLEKSFDIGFNGKQMTKIDHKLIEFGQDSNEFEMEYNFSYPDNFVKGSQRLFILGKIETDENSWYQNVIKNSELSGFKFEYNMIPCEERMPRLFSQISAVKYLKNSEKISQDDLKIRLKEIGSEFNHACLKTPYDGSIVTETFKGNVSNDAGLKSSTWLTSQYLKYMKDYSKMNGFSNNKIYFTTSWLKKQEIFTGEFLEKDPEFQTRPNIKNYPVYLTAISFIELESDMNYVENKPEVLKYLDDHYSHLETNYEKVIVCLVFHMAEHGKRGECFSEFLTMIATDKDKKFVKEPNEKPDIEASTYGLLILVNRNHFSLAYGIFQYLKTIMKSNGIIGYDFQASLALNSMADLVQMAQNYNKAKKEVSINLNHKDHSMILQDGTEITQIYELPSDTNSIKMKLSGFGKANIYFATKYNSENGTSNTPRSSVIELCKITKHTSDGYKVTEFDLPKGLTFQSYSDSTKIKSKVETNSLKTNVVFYTNKNDKVCYKINVKALDTYKLPSSAPLQFYPTMNEFKIYQMDLA